MGGWKTPRTKVEWHRTPEPCKVRGGDHVLVNGRCTACGLEFNDNDKEKKTCDSSTR